MSEITNDIDHGKIVIGSIMGGYPDLGMTEEFVMEMMRGGADIIEIRIPFSDPVADGPAMQEANCRSLQSGTDLDGLFQLVKGLRQKTPVPIIFKTYLNPVFHHGYQRFFHRCQEVGLDGIVILDLPLEEMDELAGICGACGVELISTVAATSGDRIALIAAEARGFLNVLPPLAKNGDNDETESGIRSLCRSVRAATDIPLIIGAGIEDPEEAKRMVRYADGVLVDGGIVKLMLDHGSEAGPKIGRYIRDIKEALNDLQNE